MKINKKKVLLFALGLTIILAGVWTYQKFDNFLKIDSCLDNGGSWNYEQQKCEFSSKEQNFKPFKN